ncbi:MAG: sigma-54-dependent Fis family transcriptional regulator [bacterium]|nr:sigma-54-dependent Fis family transcriptional regulator [bacterium]
MTRVSSLRALPEDMVQAPLHEEFLGVSAAVDRIRETVARLAGADLTVLITGESGTGKDIVARLLHKQSPRYGKPFIKVNCPAIPETIIESELFGYERGAFTGAQASKPGRFELANQGTIFLDEIAEMPLHVQGKLLQVFDGEDVMRIGGTQSIQTDVRLLAATNVVLEDAVQEGRLREDIYFRLNEMVVHLPALRERPEDIPVLGEHFNYNFCQRFDKDYAPLPEDTLEAMCAQEWRGNVRELAARVKKYVATGSQEALLEEEDEGHRRREPSEGAEEPGGPVPEPPEPERTFVPLKEAARRAVESTERSLIEEALRHTLWNRRKAAKLLQVSYSSLLRRIDAYGIGKPKPE